ncbi:hypothetical protein [Propionivibrio sp.]|uniref:hypothetical protein n=1 Tax=Propionivibrio sp. TaxID=2212460 RepID=UPI0025FAAA43|nr:hypothetical protein [Propionivibrio sp.]MBK8744994.1 hypothetical protein [Propionivibrio sp.]
MLKLSPLTKFSVIAVLAIAANGVAVGAEDDFSCGALTNAYGPFDYRSDKDKLGIVEGAHFTPSVENLTRGNAGYIGGDLDYTLRAFPNHHRALMSVMRYGEKRHSDHPTDLRYSVGCYFNRALRFRPDDDTARMIYGIYLSKKGRNKEALEQLNSIQTPNDDNANLHYNLGLLFLKLGDQKKSLAHAQKAYQLGFPLPGLRDKLKRAGIWKEPEPIKREALTEEQTEAVPVPKQ